MKKTIRNTVMYIGVMLVAFGFVVCMCDTYEIGTQLITFGIGFGIVLVGVVIAFLASWEEEDAYIR